MARRARDCNHGWHGQVRHIALPDGWKHWELAHDEEAQVIEVLFTLLDEFLAAREASDASGAQTDAETGRSR
ncbi:hypothetical protein ACNF49_25075 [Actinomadura sp. ATCC 39365]